MKKHSPQSQYIEDHVKLETGLVSPPNTMFGINKANDK